MQAISTRELTKRFPRSAGYRDLIPFRERSRVTAVDGVNLEVAPGELFGLLGPNGAGKTTLIKLLCCLVLPSSGTAEVFGRDIRRQEQAVKQVVGMVSTEERSFYWRLTGRENLHFYASLYHLSPEAARERIERLLDLVGLAEEGDVRFQNYSTGMRQKLAIARGLLSDPRLLFVDEPTRSLDPLSAQAVRSFLKEKVAAAGKTVVLATHNLAEAEQLCDRMAIMEHGRIRAVGSVQDLRAVFRTHDGCDLVLRHCGQDTLDRLGRIDGVLACELMHRQNGNVRLSLKLVDRARVLPHIFGTIVRAGAEVCDCQTRELPLEEVFHCALRAGREPEDR